MFLVLSLLQCQPWIHTHAALIVRSFTSTANELEIANSDHYTACNPTHMLAPLFSRAVVHNNIEEALVLQLLEEQRVQVMLQWAGSDELRSFNP